MALLHATVRVAVPLGLRVLALHVHHGLSPNADAWQAHVAACCRRWSRRGLPVEVVCERVASAPAAGASVEAWAREVRYGALERLARAHGASLVLLAHHRRDQAETLLLQALRGGGVAGLSAMPRVARRAGIAFARPWLDQPPDAIAGYVRARRIAHIEDESNRDPRFDRNRLRLDVWPALARAFPRAEAALADSAARLRGAREALDELAAQDLLDLAPLGPLVLERWSRLRPGRALNALRAWLRRETGASWGAATLERLRAELPMSRDGRWPLGAWCLRIHRGSLHAVATVPRDDATAREPTLCIDGPGVYPLPGWRGAFNVEPALRGGVTLRALRHLELVARRGGERWQAGVGRPARGLKKQWQAAGVPAWQREGPLVYSDGRLLYVPGLGLDARRCAVPEEAQVTLQWLARGAERSTG